MKSQEREEPKKNKPCPVLRRQVGFRLMILNSEDMIQGSPGSVSVLINTGHPVPGPLLPVE